MKTQHLRTDNAEPGASQHYRTDRGQLRKPVRTDEGFDHMRAEGIEITSRSRQRYEMEVRAKRHLLENAERLGLEPEEIQDTQIQLDDYLRKLRDLGDQP